MRSVLLWIAVAVCSLGSVAAVIRSDGFGKPRDTEAAISFLGKRIDSIKGFHVCLDGTLPGYHLDRGFGSGANRWIIHLEGGGCCNSHSSCVYRKTTRRGSSRFMEKALNFTGILSNKPQENPDFFHWNRIMLRYCNGASFAWDSQDEGSQLFYRGQRIWQVAMEEFMSLGMQKADQALLSGCSAGGSALR
ncbi:unnamed protein product [Thlaspi arvense]|uniref:Pectin acetylesterase n=1 Tax=Thlaspi arvense TaxID=13288 RepID=A0AAU9T2N6_THLAR|nr:unnamed protein product [Thlaspi arvense]